MPISEELLELFKWRPRPGPGPGPDPASLLQFIVDLEQPAIKQAAIGAYLDYAAATAQAQVHLVQALQKAVNQKAR